MSTRTEMKMPENEMKQGPVAAVLEKGTIADTRRGPMCDPSQLWRSPNDYRTLDEDIIRSMSKLQGMQQAELHLAATELVKQGPTMKSRFGMLAPDVSTMAGLFQRYQHSRDGLAIALAQVAYFTDVNRVATHDMLQLIGRVDKAVRPIAEENVEVAEQFAAVLKISDQRGDMIKQGRARGKEAGNGGGEQQGPAPVAVVEAKGDGK